MSKLTEYEIYAKTQAFKLLQKELGWVRTNMKPFVIGAIAGGLVILFIVKVL